MKPFKQSNSMKELLKKLRRHDTLVMGAGVMAATILCGAFVYVTTPAISADAAAEEVRKDSLGVQKKASDQLKEIDNYLEKLDSVVTGSQDLIKEIQTVQSEQKQLTEKTIENEKNNSTVTNNTKVVEKIGGLDKELASIHTEIQNTSDQVKELKESMNKGGSENSDKDKENFSQITNALGDIKKACDKSSADVTALATQIKESRDTAGSDNKTVVNNLEKIEKQLEKVNANDTLSRMESDLLRTQNTYITKMNDLEKDVDKVDKSVSGVGKKVESGLAGIDKNVDGVENKVGDVGNKVDGVENKVGDVGNKVDGVDSKVSSVESKIGGVDGKVSSVETKVGGVENKVDGVGTKVDNGFDNVKNGVDGIQQTQNDTNDKLDTMDGRMNNIEDDIDAIDTNIQSLSEKLETVFNQVASGKSKLASALATLGVTLPEDAKFSDLENAIKQVPEAIVKASNVEYVHHHHKDGKGACPYETSKNKGGCFQVEVRHRHGPECYEEKTYYKYLTERYDTRELNHGPEKYTCNICNKTFLDSPLHEEETDDIHLAITRNVTGYKKRVERNLICKKGNIIECYAPSCGYYENSIVEAIIKYDKKNDPETSLMSTNQGVNFIDGEILFEEFIPGNNGESEVEDYPESEAPDIENEEGNDVKQDTEAGDDTGIATNQQPDDSDETGVPENGNSDEKKENIEEREGNEGEGEKQEEEKQIDNSAEVKEGVSGDGNDTATPEVTAENN